MATVLALDAGGLLIVTRPMESATASTMQQICVMWTPNFRLSLKEIIDDIMVDFRSLKKRLNGSECSDWERRCLQ